MAGVWQIESPSDEEWDVILKKDLNKIMAAYCPAAPSFLFEVFCPLHLSLLKKQVGQ
jgi:hypothetical protein